MFSFFNKKFDFPFKNFYNKIKISDSIKME